MRGLRMIFASVLALALVLAAAFGAGAQASFLSDIDGRLTSQQSAQVSSALSQVSERTGVGIYYYVRVRSNAYDAVSETELRAYLGIDSGDSAVVLAVDCYADGSYYYELFTVGDAYGMLSDSACNRILDDSELYSSIKAGALAQGAVRFATVCAEEIESGRAREAALDIAVPIIVGLSAGAIAVLIVVTSYRRKLRSPIYPLSKYASLDLSVSHDNYLTSNVTRVRIQSSSGGSGGGSSGGGSRGRR